MNENIQTTVPNTRQRQRLQKKNRLFSCSKIRKTVKRRKIDQALIDSNSSNNNNNSSSSNISSSDELDNEMTLGGVTIKDKGNHTRLVTGDVTNNKNKRLERSRYGVLGSTTTMAIDLASDQDS